MKKEYERKNKLYYPPFIPFFVIQIIYNLQKIKKILSYTNKIFKNK